MAQTFLIVYTFNITSVIYIHPVADPGGGPWRPGVPIPVKTSQKKMAAKTCGTASFASHCPPPPGQISGSATAISLRVYGTIDKRDLFKIDYINVSVHKARICSLCRINMHSAAFVA